MNQWLNEVAMWDKVTDGIREAMDHRRTTEAHEARIRDYIERVNIGLLWKPPEPDPEIMLRAVVEARVAEYALHHPEVIR